MRDYAKLAPTFWTGNTGKALRRRGSEALIVAVYLVSAPGSNMLGLYYQPLLFMAHETGLGIEGASKGLQDCIDVGFCSYDKAAEMVFVHEMAAWQISESLSSADKRCKGIQKDYDGLPECAFLEEFFDRYSAAFHLQNRRANQLPDPDPDEGASQAPSKPHRSQEQEQEQDLSSIGGGQKPLPAAGAARSKRGSRLDPGWSPGDTGFAFASQQGLTNGRAHVELEKFRDHWSAATGQKASKLDWQAAWRTWVRNAIEFSSGKRSTASDPFEGAH